MSDPDCSCFSRPHRAGCFLYREPEIPSTVKLLEARRAAIEQVIKECGGEKSERPDDAALHGTLVMLAREAAGAGFDAGVKYMAGIYEAAKP